jgi:hypothetical protein
MERHREGCGKGVKMERLAVLRLQKFVPNTLTRQKIESIVQKEYACSGKSES